MSAPHLGVSAKTANDGVRPAVALVLRASSKPPVNGWDVCVGAASPSCSANLEDDLQRTLQDYALEILPRANAPEHVTLQICVVERLER
ncbi:MAG: hypothetical protein HOO96_44240 [Polyangiaceae bacterium]|nr:hypothetical protein [Polyangiaceae bacterium]